MAQGQQYEVPKNIMNAKGLASHMNETWTYFQQCNHSYYWCLEIISNVEVFFLSNAIKLKKNSVSKR